MYEACILISYREGDHEDDKQSQSITTMLQEGDDNKHQFFTR